MPQRRECSPVAAMDVRPHTLHWLQPRRAEFLEVCLLPLRGKAVADAGDFSLADVAG